MAIDLYSKHFGFSERPFSLSPDPDILFWSRGHTRAFTVLEYGLTTHAPLTVITGEVGTGKTTLIQSLLRQIEDDITLGLISNAQGDRGDLLRWVLNALDVVLPEHHDYISLFQMFQDFVIGEYAAGRRVVLIIDEAQNLGGHMLEELRMLTNINSGKDELLQIILVGQPELRHLITLPELRQFAQRVTATFHINPFEEEEARAYVQYRLRHVDGSGDEFTQAAMHRIFTETGGVPRLINKLCDLALVYAASAGHRQVDADIIGELLDDGLILKTSASPLFLTDRIDISGKAAE